MKAGDIVRLLHGSDNELYVILKGPYELVNRVSVGITELYIAYDLYSTNGVMTGARKENLEIVKRC